MSSWAIITISWFVQGPKHLEEARKGIPKTHQMNLGLLELSLGLARQMTGQAALAMETLEERIRSAELSGGVQLARGLPAS